MLQEICMVVLLGKQLTKVQFNAPLFTPIAVINSFVKPDFFVIQVLLGTF